MRATILTVLLLAFSPHEQVIAGCDNAPAEVRAYLQSDPEWSLVTTRDLVADDKFLWEKYHADLCPGFAIVDLKGDGTKAFAMAFLQHEKGRVIEKAVVVMAQTKQSFAQILAPPKAVTFANIAAPLVVWRAGPGSYRDLVSNRTIQIPHDAVVYEKWKLHLHFISFPANGSNQSLFRIELLHKGPNIRSSQASIGRGSRGVPVTIAACCNGSKSGTLFI